LLFHVLVCAIITFAATIDLSSTIPVFTHTETSLVATMATDQRGISLIVTLGDGEDFDLAISDVGSHGDVVYAVRLAGSVVTLRAMTETDSLSTDSDVWMSAKISSELSAAFEQFCQSDYGYATAALSDQLARQGLTGDRSRVFLLLHSIVPLCMTTPGYGEQMKHGMARVTKAAASPVARLKPVKARGPECFFTTCIDVQSSCPRWNGQSNCVKHGRLETSSECASDCFGLCGPSCLCWYALCGDCCYHPGCAAHDAQCRNKGAFAFFACMAGFGCIIGAPSGGCC